MTMPKEWTDNIKAQEEQKKLEAPDNMNKCLKSYIRFNHDT